uniref:Efflux RND transporter periplasmic adaptor subunit n=1 Tax=Eiseniibacteriota bacterium TaxID=2212470 RepID=A0A832I4Y5_UNCEI
MTEARPDLSKLRLQREPFQARAARRNPRRWLVVAVTVAAVSAAVLLLRPRAPVVETVPAQATGGGTSSSQGISANGYVVARTKASVAAKIPGRLEELRVTEGTRVRRGEIIARLESGDFEAQVAAARAALAQADAALAQARRDLERARRLREGGANTPFELEDAETRARVAAAQVEAARAQLRLAEVNLENTRVRAPFDGTVLRKDAEVGEIVVPSSAGGGLTRTAIATMADLATLEVEVDVNEAYIAQIRNGQASAITLDAYPDTSFRGRVRQVVPTADRQKATVLVKVSILDRDPRILPEMGAKVVFLRDESAAVTAAPRRVLVPAEALVNGPEGASVWVVSEGRASRVKVDAGPESGGQIEVRSGLAGGESVILRPPAGLKDGAPVRVAGA